MHNYVHKSWVYFLLPPVVYGSLYAHRCATRHALPWAGRQAIQGLPTVSGAKPQTALHTFLSFHPLHIKFLITYVLHTQARIYIHIYTYVRAYIHTYIRTCVHTYIHTYLHTPLPIIQDTTDRTVNLSTVLWCHCTLSHTHAIPCAGIPCSFCKTSLGNGSQLYELLSVVAAGWRREGREGERGGASQYTNIH